MLIGPQVEPAGRNNQQETHPGTPEVGHLRDDGRGSDGRRCGGAVCNGKAQQVKVPLLGPFHGVHEGDE